MRCAVPEDLKEELAKLGVKSTVGEVIALRVAFDAMQGKAHAIDTILDRTDGKARDLAEQPRPIVQMPSVIFNGKEAEFEVGD